MAQTQEQQGSNQIEEPQTVDLLDKHFISSTSIYLKN